LHHRQCTRPGRGGGTDLGAPRDGRDRVIGSVQPLQRVPASFR
jgi:hypothetical protein